jgi:hypothetical protein
MKKLIFTIFILFLLPSFAFAGLYHQVTPAIIDHKALPRDVIQETILIENTGPAKINIYTFVNNIDKEEGETEFKARDEIVLSDSMANWIEISRGTIELAPGESIEVPVAINVNLRAKPGIYHALISFSQGPTRQKAKDRIDFAESVLVNIEVTEDIKERLQLDTFATDKIFFGGSDISFKYNLENVGNKDLQPKGEVRIYDRRGREIGAVPANIEGAIIKPEDVGQIASVWSAGKGFGKYKALLDIEYGNSQIGTVNDTIYFWIIPWKQLLAIFIILSLIVGGGTYFLYQKYEDTHQPGLARTKPTRYKKFDENSLLVPQHTYSDGAPKPLSEEHLLNLRS